MSNRSSLFHINRQNKTPLYHQISQNLRGLIENGRIQANEAVPSEWDLSELYGVSRLTVRRAIDDLEREGLLVRRHGVGTFVANLSEARIFPSELSFTKNMEQIGRTPSSHIISCQTIAAVERIATQLHIDLNEKVHEISRLRLVDGEPLMLETSYLAYGRFPNLDQADLAAGSLYTYLETEHNITITALDQAMEPVLLTQYEAELLKVPTGSPAILSEIIGFANNSEPIEYAWSVTCGGRGRFYFHFREGDMGKRSFSSRLMSGIARK